MTGEEARYVLEEDGGRSVSLHKGEECEGEGGSFAREPASLAGDAEVLAGEPAGPEGGVSPAVAPEFACSEGVGDTKPMVDTTRWLDCSMPPASARNIPGPSFHQPRPDVENVTEVRDSRPSLAEDRRGVGVDLGEGDGSPTGSLKPHIESAHS